MPRVIRWNSISGAKFYHRVAGNTVRLTGSGSHCRYSFECRGGLVYDRRFIPETVFQQALLLEKLNERAVFH